MMSEASIVGSNARATIVSNRANSSSVIQPKSDFRLFWAQIQFWDALIVASAEEADATWVYSEDLNEGQTIAGVKIINPLVS